MAASLIEDGETIILDSGTTTAEIAKQIRRLEVRSINVITNALNIATLLADVPTVRLIMPGGILRPESNSLSGHMDRNSPFRSGSYKRTGSVGTKARMPPRESPRPP